MDWLDLDFFQSDRFNKVAKYIAKEREQGKIILPAQKNILRALVETPPEEVKVVIMGQDPYPDRGHANGLCFSVNPGVTPLPKTLNNILGELKDDLGIVKESGDLSEWARQGVLLLNATFTVVEGQRGSHRGIGWEALSTEAIRYLNEHFTGIVYILWGKDAQPKEMYVNSDTNLIIKSSHPSPLAAYRSFFGSRPFSRTNKYLTEIGKTPITW